MQHGHPFFSKLAPNNCFRQFKVADRAIPRQAAGLYWSTVTEFVGQFVSTGQCVIETWIQSIKKKTLLNTLSFLWIVPPTVVSDPKKKDTLKFYSMYLFFFSGQKK